MEADVVTSGLPIDDFHIPGRHSPPVTVCGSPLRPILRNHVLFPAFDPVRCDALLGIGQRYLTSADETVKLVLESVLFGIAWARIVRLGP